MSTKIQLVSVEAFASYAKKPVQQDIGEDIQAFIRRVSMDEFFDIQGLIKKADEARGEMSGNGKDDDDAKLREGLKKSFTAVAEVMVRVVTNEKGEAVYTAESIPQLVNLMNPKFVGDFIKAFMKAQGISEEEPAIAEKSFPAKS